MSENFQYELKVYLSRKQTKKLLSALKDNNKLVTEGNKTLIESIGPVTDLKTELTNTKSHITVGIWRLREISLKAMPNNDYVGTPDDLISDFKELCNEIGFSPEQWPAAGSSIVTSANGTEQRVALH